MPKDQITNPIKEYDQGLEQDIISLEQYIAKDEELAKTEMLNRGFTAEVIDKLAIDKRAQGKHLQFDYPACIASDEILALLKELSLCIKDSPFRIMMNPPSVKDDWLSIRIVTEGQSYLYDANVLSTEQQKQFAEQMYTLLPLYRYWTSYGISRCYPSNKVMMFMSDVIKEPEVK